MKKANNQVQATVAHKTVRAYIAQTLGVSRESANYLVKAYGKANGKVAPDEIIQDVHNLTFWMVVNAAKTADTSALMHELYECGKDRTWGAVYTLCGEGNEADAGAYLIRKPHDELDAYADTVALWRDALVEAVKARLRRETLTNINNWRELVGELPGCIGRVMRVFQLESEAANFLVREGEWEDFDRFSCDPEHRLPKHLTRAIFSEMKAVQDGTIQYDSVELRRGLGHIHRSSRFTAEEKKALQGAFIHHSISYGYYYTFRDMLKVANFGTIKQLLDNDHHLSWEEINALITEDLPAVKKAEQEKAQEKYEQLLATLKGEEDLDQIKKLVYEFFKDSRLEDWERIFYPCPEKEEAEKGEGYLYILYSASVLEFSRERGFRLPAEELTALVKAEERKEEERAMSKLEQLAESGIGNFSPSYWENDSVLKDGEWKEVRVCYLEGEKYSHTNLRIVDTGEGDLVAEACYRTFYGSTSVEMTREQVERYNAPRDLKIVQEKNLYTDIGECIFAAGGETYHVRETGWSTHGGVYTIVWKEEDHDRAIGLTTSRSEWARAVCPVDPRRIFRMAGAQPDRFRMFFEKQARESDCCGTFPLFHVEDAKRKLLLLPAENAEQAEAI